MRKKDQDRIFARKLQVQDFVFDRKVADVFDEMLERSVPLYGEIQRMVVEMACRFAQEGTNIYDLGCATGATVLKIAERMKERSIRVIGVDNSTPMLKHTQEKLKKGGFSNRCELQYADLNRSLFLDNPSVVILILTLQFVRPIHRDMLIRQIYESLAKNGCIIVVEKILSGYSTTNRLFIDLYHDYKKRKGYSQLEISQKREALENILIPYHIEENTLLLRRNGFPVIDVFFKWYNFAGLLGVKQ